MIKPDSNPERLRMDGPSRCCTCPVSVRNQQVSFVSRYVLVALTTSVCVAYSVVDGHRRDGSFLCYVSGTMGAVVVELCALVVAATARSLWLWRCRGRTTKKWNRAEGKGEAATRRAFVRALEGTECQQAAGQLVHLKSREESSKLRLSYREGAEGSLKRSASDVGGSVSGAVQTSQRYHSSLSQAFIERRFTRLDFLPPLETLPEKKCFSQYRKWVSKVYQRILPLQKAKGQLRVLFWSVAWLWNSHRMQRKSNSNLLTWECSTTESWYLLFQGGFFWISGVDLIWVLMTAPRFRDCWTCGGVVNLFVMVLCGFATWSTNVGIPWWGMFGFLAGLHVGLPWESRAMEGWIMSRAKLRVLGIFLNTVRAIFCYAAALFIVESSSENQYYRNYYSFLYFAFVTISTVGYGDFAPQTPLGRLLTAALVALAMAYVPYEVQAIRETQLAASRSRGTIIAENYAVLVGPVTYAELRVYCQTVSETASETISQVVLLTPMALDEYRGFRRFARAALGLTVAFRKCEGPQVPREFHEILSGAAVIVIVANGDGSVALRNRHDSLAMINCLSANDVAFGRTPLCLVVNGHGFRSFAYGLGVSGIVSRDELTGRLLARSVSGCPGVSGLLLGWLLPGLPEASCAELEQGRSSGSGKRTFLQRTRLSRSVFGFRFSQVCLWVFKHTASTALGFQSANGKYFLNPKQRCFKHGDFGRDTESGCFLFVLVTDRRHLGQVAECLEKLDSDQVDDSEESEEAAVSGVSPWEEFFLDQSAGSSGSRDVRVVDTYDDIPEIARRGKRLVLVCGVSGALRSFLSALEEDMHADVLPLVLCSIDSFEELAGLNVHCITGSCWSRVDLGRDGLHRASAVVICGARQCVPLDVEFTVDRQVALTVRVVRQSLVLHRVAVAERFASPESRHLVTIPEPPLFIELLTSHGLELLDWSDVAGGGRWSRDALAGNLIIQETLIGLASQLHQLEEAQVQAGVLKELLKVPLRETRSAQSSHSTIMLVPVPTMWVYSTYQRLFAHLLLFEKQLTVGIYRRIGTANVDDLRCGHPCVTRYQIPNPDPLTCLCPTDQIYVLT